MTFEISELPLNDRAPSSRFHASPASFASELEAFRDFGVPTRRLDTQFTKEFTPARKNAPGRKRSVQPPAPPADITSPAPLLKSVPTYVNEFWTAKQRAASRLHEASYRACF